ncbi:mannitol dehydrogenase family protein [Yoonia sp. R2331]|uniref:mannitol dehydrogenase family protein n=1 Tax=Yoonia sp. R2331 TaxID=3237238 RepID=UPI0034E521CC
MADYARLTRSGPPPKVGIVHLGPGAFFRAFNAVYTHEAMETDKGDWGILAVSLRSPTARDQLNPQGGTYTAVTLGGQGMVPKQIESIAGVLVAPEDPKAVVDAMADPAVKIVSLTITEKGYCRSPSTGRLDETHPDIAHDLAGLEAPVSAIGFIVAALAARRKAGVAPFTVLSCDNLPSNGALVRDIVQAFARLFDADLARWIEEHVVFPSTMVDRITPATTPDDRKVLSELTGYQDEACVFHEPFRQWVIEDRFPQGKPAWGKVGAQMVTSVHAHEVMKLRCLNGAHSMLAYLGYLAGYDTIAETVADPHFAALCQNVWRDEIIPTVPQPDGEDLTAYCATLMERFKDPAIRHRTWQIATDGSQKLPQRILGTFADNLAQGRSPKGLALAVAGWMRYVGGVDENGGDIDVRDPLAQTLRKTSESAQSATGKVQALLDVEDVFAPRFAQDAQVQRLLSDAYDDLVNLGAKAAVQRAASNP